MDRLESLGNQLSQLTMYDLKAAYNQAKNMVLNVSETEAKVREATNDDPWGASSTLMQDIAQGTFNFQQFNEIMPCIYQRFMDKEARQWREIYKALQLLEYIIKHGSERVIDDARSHLSTIKMLRNFHYIDDKGKDQGINVRNRAKELSELLMDVERIRTERRKAKANKDKYIGAGSDGMSFGSGRYGGFGSDSLGSGSRSYGGGGGSYEQDYGGYGGGGSSSGGFRDAGSRHRVDEYNAGDDEIDMPRRSNSLASRAAGTAASSRASTSSTAAPAPAKASEKVVDLIGLGDEEEFSAPVSAPAAAPSAEKALPAVASNPLDDGDDDFADFQSAGPPPANITTPAPAPARAGSNVFDMLSPAAAPAKPAQPTMGSIGALSPSASTFTSPVTSPGPAPGFGSVMSPVMSPTSAAPSMGRGAGTGMGMNAMRPIASSASSFSTQGAKSPTKPGAAGSASASVGFDDLWNLGLGAAGKPKAGSAAPATGGKSMKDLEREKAQASIWGGAGGVGTIGGAGVSGASAGSTGGASGGGGVDDLLF